MSYLNLPTGIPDLTNIQECIISLWFRVPQTSINACNEAVKNDDSPFDGVIPLVCFGPIGTGLPKISFTSVVACHTYFKFGSAGAVLSETDLGYTPTSVLVTVLDLDPVGPTTIPSCIGVDCRFKDEKGVISPTLFINLETGKKANTANAGFTLTGVIAATTYAFVGDIPPPNVDAVFTYTNIAALATENFAGSSEIKVNADHWHHVLLSFSLKDVTTKGKWPDSVSANTESASQMWLAFDDENYTESDLSDYWPDKSANPNAILTPNAYDIAGLKPSEGGNITYNSTDPSNYGVFIANGPPAGIASFSLEGPTIPDGRPVGIPATAEFVANIYRVEMAELQIFTGVTLDTSVTSKRRAFVDFERDENGEVILDDDGNSTLKPVNPKRAEGLLGRRQAVLLHESSNWVTGYNTGSTGVVVDTDENGNEVLIKQPDGQFKPVARIRPYKPDPSLKQTG